MQAGGQTRAPFHGFVLKIRRSALHMLTGVECAYSRLPSRRRSLTVYYHGILSHGPLPHLEGRRRQDLVKHFFSRLLPAACDVHAFKLLRPHRPPTRPSAPGEVQDSFQAGPGSRSRLRLGWPRASEGRARDGLLDCDGDDALPSPWTSRPQPQREQLAARVARGGGRDPAGSGAPARSIARQPLLPARPGAVARHM